ncbi:MAG: putative RND superfamily exporter protein [Planctomycetota bacterium]
MTAVPLLSGILLAGKAACRVPRGASVRVPVEAFIRWVVRHAKLVSVIGITTTLALLAVAMQLVPDNRLTEATPDGSEAVAALAALERGFGGGLPGIVLCEWPESVSIDSPELSNFIAEIQAMLDEHPYTHSPLSALSLAKLLPGEAGLADVARLPVELTRRFLRADKRRALVTSLIPDLTAREAAAAELELDDGLREIVSRYPGHSATLTGTSFVARRNINVIIEDFVIGLAMAAGIIWIVLTIALKSWRLGLLAILPNAFPLVMAAASLVLMGLELQVASAIAFTVCLGIAVDDTIHFLARYRRERAEGQSKDEAVVRAVIGVGSALIVTTLVLLAGFGVIGLSAIPTSRLFAWLCTLGLVGALIGDLIMLPALVAAFDEDDEPTSANA